MDVTPIIPEDRQVVDSYGPGRFRIANTVYESSVLVFPDRTIPWAARSVDELQADSFAPVLEAEPPVEIVLLGCGSRMQLPPSALRRMLRGAGLVLDVMDTGAACRTFNILMSEDRRVAAALIAIA